MNTSTAHECMHALTGARSLDRSTRKPRAGACLPRRSGDRGGSRACSRQGGGSREQARGLLARLGRDTRAAIGVPGVLVAAMLVGATALPVTNVTLKAEKRRMEDAAAAAGLAATQKMRTEGVGVSQADLRREAERYARFNLLDLPPDARRKALESLQIHMASDPVKQIVQVDLEATLPGRNVVQALMMVAPGSGGKAILPEKSTGRSEVQCVSDKVELVLAVDMTDSMNASLSQAGMSPQQRSRRLDVTADVAAEMVGNIQRLCSDMELEVGIVPWGSSVKVPDGQEKRWKRNGWIDASRFTLRGADQSMEAQQWGGCLEDRLMNSSTRREASFGLSLDTAEDRYFPPYVYPDTGRHTKRGEWTGTMWRFIELQRVRGVRGLPSNDPGSLAQILRGDNDWNRGGGPNKGCTQVGMIPPRTLESTDTWFDEVLARIREAELTDEGTMAHLGVTWGRRMLHPAWDAIWDPAGDPDDAKGGSGLKKDESVMQVLVLLSDGTNGGGLDPWHETPGRASVHLGVDLAADGTEVKRLSLSRDFTSGVTLASTNLETAVVTGYSALGRNGPGALADGHRGDTDHITSSEAGLLAHQIPDLRRKSRDFLDELLRTSCAEARKEGIEVYTVSLSDDSQASNSHQNAVLQACAGTDTAPGAADYAFQADDVDGIRAAFRDIGQRIARIRRAG